MAERRRDSGWNHIGYVIWGLIWNSICVYQIRFFLLPQSASNIRKALVLAGIVWFVLFLVPALKFPANPPAVRDPETIYYREILYIGLVAISGFAALGLAFLYRKLHSIALKIIQMLPNLISKTLTF